MPCRTRLNTTQSSFGSFPKALFFKFSKKCRDSKVPDLIQKTQKICNNDFETIKLNTLKNWSKNLIFRTCQRIQNNTIQESEVNS